MRGVSRRGSSLTVLAEQANAAVVTSRISHTSFDAADAYSQSLFWSHVLGGQLRYLLGALIGVTPVFIDDLGEHVPVILRGC